MKWCIARASKFVWNRTDVCICCMRLFLVLECFNRVLGLDIGKYVKQFIVSLQIYMGDVNASVQQFCCTLFNVTLVFQLQRRRSSPKRVVRRC